MSNRGLLAFEKHPSFCPYWVNRAVPPLLPDPGQSTHLSIDHRIGSGLGMRPKSDQSPPQFPEVSGTRKEVFALC